jgi:hypothetical protein
VFDFLIRQPNHLTEGQAFRRAAEKEVLGHRPYSLLTERI